jgi:hypothetical protein
MSTSVCTPPLPLSSFRPEVLAQKKRDRNRGALILGISPLPDEAPLQLHYQEPSLISKIYISSYVRHVAHVFPHSDADPNSTVKAVKVYHVVHEMLTPALLVQGYSPLDLTLYRPYFMGEFNPDGSFTDRGATDPFLYWLLPIYRETQVNGGGQRLVNSLDIHAGSTNPRLAEGRS